MSILHRDISPFLPHPQSGESLGATFSSWRLCSSPCRSPFQLIMSKVGCSYSWPPRHAPWSLRPAEQQHVQVTARTGTNLVGAELLFTVPGHIWDHQSCTGCTFMGRGLHPTSALPSYLSDCGTPVGEQPKGENREIKACFTTTTTYTGIYYNLSGLTFNSKSSWDDRQPHAGWLYLTCRLDTKST